MNFLLVTLLMLQAAGPSGSISGTVVLAGSPSQSPLIMARVELSGGPALPSVVRTDGEGRFAFTNLPAGSYRLRVTKDSFIRQEYSKRASIVIKPGEVHNPVVIAMERAPTLAGRIQSEFGEPIANIQVQAFKAGYGTDGKRSFTPLASTLSDDRGEYRLYWLDPGEYIIGASFVPAVRTPGNPIDPVARVVYAPTYYPAAPDLANAQRISLKADQNILTLDFRLVRVPAPTVRGSVENAGKGRAPKVSVTLVLAGDATGAARYAAKSDDFGNFEINNVAPGNYIATATSVIGNELHSASKHIVIYNRDENNVGLVLGPGIPVMGRVALETGAAFDAGATSVHLYSTDPYLDSFAEPRIPSDGQFVIRGVQPGAYSLDIAGIPEDLYIKAERSGQTDILGAPLAVAWESPAAVEVLLASDGGLIEGSVADSAGKPFAGAQLVLVPNAGRRDRAVQYRSANSDEEGKFELRGIPPGAYQLFAWENIEERAWLNSDFMLNYQTLGTPITVAPGSKGTLLVPLIPEKR